MISWPLLMADLIT